MTEDKQDERMDESLTIRMGKTLRQRINRLARIDKRRPGEWARIKIEEAVEHEERKDG